MNPHIKVLLSLLLTSLFTWGASYSLLAQAHSHEAPHGGSLSVIEGCGLGHVELKIIGNSIELWFLDGGHETGRSIRIPEASFPLSLVGQNGERIETVMLADPLRLAGEKVGMCSHFRAVVSGLEQVPRFLGFGWVRFKGQMRPLRLCHPADYSPDVGLEPGEPGVHSAQPGSESGDPGKKPPAATNKSGQR